jgi:hypothetical protein
MARVEFRGVIYHVMSRGDRRGDIFQDDVHDGVNCEAAAAGMRKTAVMYVVAVPHLSVMV